MGNSTSSPPKKSSSRRSGRSRDRKRDHEGENVATRAQKVVGESVQNLSANLQSSIKKLEEDDHPAAQFLDSVCGGYLDPGRGNSRNNSFYSDYDDETLSEVDDETTTTTDYRDRRSRRGRRSKDEPSVGESASYGESDIDSEDRRKKKAHPNLTNESYDTEESSRKHGVVNQVAEITANSTTLSKPLASSFAKRCYFTKAGIGKTTQHYEGLTLTGNVVLMLAAAMKLKGCPTICDEDLRRVEQTYPNQFSRLPDELLLSSGWRRISKYCHFSNKPIPDGVPFFREYFLRFASLLCSVTIFQLIRIMQTRNNGYIRRVDITFFWQQPLVWSVRSTWNLYPEILWFCLKQTTLLRAIRHLEY